MGVEWRPKTSKLILSAYEQSVCRVHFILVGSVISFILVLMGTIVAATTWYHYSLPLYSLLATVVAFYSAWTLRIRLLILSGMLLFGEVAFELLALIILSSERLAMYHDCYLNNYDCEFPNWQLQMLNHANGIAFIFPSIIITFINMVSIIYLVYLFRHNTRQK